MLAPSCGVMRTQKPGFYETLFSSLSLPLSRLGNRVKRKTAYPVFIGYAAVFSKKSPNGSGRFLQAEYLLGLFHPLDDLHGERAVLFAAAAGNAV